MYTVGSTGRLILGRVQSFATDDECAHYCDEYRRVARAVGPRFVNCADYRAVPVFSPGAAEHLKQLMIDMNDRVERSAMLVDPAHATNALQVGRLARETQHESRRRFSDARQLERWLGEGCTPDERQALTAFLATR